MKISIDDDKIKIIVHKEERKVLREAGNMLRQLARYADHNPALEKAPQVADTMREILATINEEGEIATRPVEVNKPQLTDGQPPEGSGGEGEPEAPPDPPSGRRSRATAAESSR